MNHENEYAEALNDIADLLDMPTGSTSAQIVKMAGNFWASGIHTCHDQCSRAMCVLRRERDEAIRKNARIPRSGLELAELLARHGVVQSHAIDDSEDYDGCVTLDRIYAAHKEMISANDKGLATQPAPQMPEKHK